jgi:hypothetical protein
MFIIISLFLCFYVIAGTISFFWALTAVKPFRWYYLVLALFAAVYWPTLLLIGIVKKLFKI